jgi:tRNA(Ile)-lysidine synthase
LPDRAAQLAFRRVSDLVNRVGQSVLARKLFRPEQRILVAVSGGVDSMVLLHLLHELAPRHGWQLAVAHFNHQLRGRSSAADERLVRRTAARLRLPVVVGRADVRGSAHSGRLSLEMAARRLRHDFLAATAVRRRIPTIALAHHADDQLELFFLRLLRGSGGEGLGGMKWRGPSPSNPIVELARPLLDQPKAALREHAREHGIPYREDTTNALLDFQRNRMRHELLPLLRRKYQPALDRTLSRVMEIVGAEAEFVAQAAAEWLRGRGSRRARARRPNFEKLPVAVQRGCVRLQLLGRRIVPEFELVESLRLEADRPVTVGGYACQAVRDRNGRVRLQRPGVEGFRADSMEVSLQGRAGEVDFAGARIGWRTGPSKVAKRVSARTGCECFDADQVGSVVILRHWRPGDRFQPIGMARRVKLQDFFTNQKVPRAARRQLVVAATTQGEVFWVEGMRISERFKLTERTNRRLQWHWKRRLLPKVAATKRPC